MDISDLLPLLIWPLVPIAPWVLVYFAKRFEQRWARIATRTIGSLAGILGVFAVTFLFTVEHSCVRHPGVLGSPDGKHVAILNFVLGGALSNDFANVNVRSSRSLRAVTVYHGLGGWDYKMNRPSSPDIRWVDAKRLLIRHTEPRIGDGRDGGNVFCGGRVDGVEIVCELRPHD